MKIWIASIIISVSALTVMNCLDILVELYEDWKQRKEPETITKKHKDFFKLNSKQ